jgi:thiamine-monophosphate kinase
VAITGKPMDEHQRIAHYLAPLTQGEAGAYGLQNDAAAMHVPPHHQLIITSDGITAGIHLPDAATAEQLVRKLVRRNISDLAAMGAQPWRYSLNLHLTGDESPDWWDQLAATLANEQARYGMVLLGGDCSSGARAAHMSMTCYGLCNAAPLLRSNAQPGERLYLTGTIGDAALYLHTQASAFAHAYYAPEPPVHFAQSLRGIASSCIDISDGLGADAAHIAQASNCRISIAQDALPLSASAQTYRNAQPNENADFWPHILGGGDDYQLLFSAAATHADTLAAHAARHGIRLTDIGVVEAGNGVRVVNAAGDAIPLTRTGYRHA